MRARAWSLLRPRPQTRVDAFLDGLRAADYEPMPGHPAAPRAGDALVIWNRHGHTEAIASNFERAGGAVFVAENGYLCAGGGCPKYDSDVSQPGHYYALALGNHNGYGTWRVGSAERFDRLGVSLHPWRQRGNHILVCTSRGIGSRETQPPRNWLDDTLKAIAANSKRPVRVRKHPGNKAPALPLEADLENAWACVIWGSSAGIHALTRGVPVVACAPRWICKGASIEVEKLEAAELPDRAPAFAAMAWAQWTVAEIASGLPFRTLV